MISFDGIDHKRRLIAVVGGGIAGLTSAILLARAGFSVSVFEKAPELHASGTGIQISPNAYKILNSLGLGKTLHATGFAPESILVRSGRDHQILTRFPLGDKIRKRHGAPYLVIHRVDLMTLLLKACQAESGIRLHFDSEVHDAAPHANGVTLLVKNGENFDEHLVAAIVGADGAWSACRKFVSGAAKPEFTGTIAWRTLIDRENAPEIASTMSTEMWIGANAHVVAYPVRMGEAINIVATTKWADDVPPSQSWLSSPGDSDRVSSFADWHDVPRQLVGTDSNWGGWPIFSVSRPGKSNEGDICLIGDAAHAMTPHAAQGGACAIEDAAVLAHHCRDLPDDLELAFQNYADERRNRVRRIVKLSAQNQRIYHLDGFMANARDFFLRNVGERIVNNRMDWLYGWTSK